MPCAEHLIAFITSPQLHLSREPNKSSGNDKFFKKNENNRACNSSASNVILLKGDIYAYSIIGDITPDGNVRSLLESLFSLAELRFSIRKLIYSCKKKSARRDGVGERYS
ncbi:hypothetical protein Tcan_00549, partial [Toxocara canis]